MKGGNCFMSNKLIKSIGLAATVIGMGVSLVSEWVNEKKIDAKIEEKVIEAVTKQLTGRES
jgi:hypothetical protein